MPLFFFAPQPRTANLPLTAEGFEAFHAVLGAVTADIAAAGHDLPVYLPWLPPICAMALFWMGEPEVYGENHPPHASAHSVHGAREEERATHPVLAATVTSYVPTWQHLTRLHRTKYSEHRRHRPRQLALVSTRRRPFS